MNKLLYVCVAILLIAGCAPECEHTLMDDGVKPYIFKEGTYWVYSNSATGLNDTFSVVHSSTDNVTGSGPTRCRGERTWERNLMTVAHKTDTVYLIASQDLHFGNKTNGLEGYIFMPDLSGCTGRKLCFVENSTVVIGGHTFNNTAHFSTVIYNRFGAEQNVAEFFWASNIGAVKIVMQDSLSTTLELQGWHVVQ